MLSSKLTKPVFILQGSLLTHFLVEDVCDTPPHGEISCC